MTPPDSGGPCNATLGEDRVVYQCSRPKGHIGQHRDGNVTAWNQEPDSGEREVKGHTQDEREEADRVQEACTAEHAGPYVTICLDCAQKRNAVSLPLPLAQRILAALEDPGLRQTYGFVTNALAAELRAIVERKT